jgi:hypothetical protein
MTREEYTNRLHAIISTAGANAWYHQTKESWYDRDDKGIRIVVALLAILGLVFAIPSLDSMLPGLGLSWWGFGVSIVSLAAAICLNIIPVVEKAKIHGEMFRLWSNLRKNAVLEEQKSCGRKLENYHLERLQELTGEMESLHADESFPDVALLAKCQGDENERVWGKGIRTFAQAETERSRRMTPDGCPASGVSEGADSVVSASVGAPE